MEQITATIAGYRQLSEEEQALINRIKAKEHEVLALQKEVVAHVARQTEEACKLDDGAKEQRRIAAAEPHRWASIARTDFQTGFMALVRAVAQPVTP